MPGRVANTLVLGVGNLLLGDEGVGVHAVRALQREPLPERVAAVEVGTAFLEVLPEVERADRIVVVDAMEGGGAPGTIYRIAFDECAHPPVLASLHGLDLSRVFYLAGRRVAPHAVVIGVEPARIDWGVELSPRLQDAIPEIVAVIRSELVR